METKPKPNKSPTTEQIPAVFHNKVCFPAPDHPHSYFSIFYFIYLHIYILILKQISRPVSYIHRIQVLPLCYLFFHCLTPENYGCPFYQAITMTDEVQLIIRHNSQILDTLLLGIIICFVGMAYTRWANGYRYGHLTKF